jgi:F-type H+-transporting ATPase subunit b
MRVTPILTSLQAAAGGGLTDVNLGLTIWTIVLFVLFAFVLGKFAWGPLLALIDEREKGVKNEIEGAQKANAEAAQLLEKHKELVREAGREREEILKRALLEAEQIKNDIQGKARGEAEQILERARAQIERERDAAIGQLRQTVADLAIEAAGKIVQSSLTPEAQRKIVDEYVAGLAAPGPSGRA